MPGRKGEDGLADELNFERKAGELDFDPWGLEEEDESVRRRDPLRRPRGERLNDDQELE